MDDKVIRVFEIVNVKGLHARASAKFVETVEAYDASAEVEKDGLSACGDSIMGLLMLAASNGIRLLIIIWMSESSKKPPGKSFFISV